MYPLLNFFGFFVGFRFVLSRTGLPSTRSFLLNSAYRPSMSEVRRRVWRRSQSRPSHSSIEDNDCPSPAGLLPLLPQSSDPGPQSTVGLDVTTLFAPVAGLLEVTEPPINRVVPIVTAPPAEVSTVHPRGCSNGNYRSYGSCMFFLYMFPF